MRPVDERLNRQNKTQPRIQKDIQEDTDGFCLSESDRRLLSGFRTKINNIMSSLCPVCNECFPSIELVEGECRRCYSDENIVKRFSADNNMDPGEIPDELRDFTEIEEMLITQVFPIVSVYTVFVVVNMRTVKML